MENPIFPRIHRPPFRALNKNTQGKTHEKGHGRKDPCVFHFIFDPLIYIYIYLYACCIYIYIFEKLRSVFFWGPKFPALHLRFVHSSFSPPEFQKLLARHVIATRRTLYSGLFQWKSPGGQQPAALSQWPAVPELIHLPSFPVRSTSGPLHRYISSGDTFRSFERQGWGKVLRKVVHGTQKNAALCCDR